MKEYASIKKIIIIILIVLGILISIIYGIIYYKKQEKESYEISESLNNNKIKQLEKPKKDNSKNNIVVDIKGEVHNPSIYKVKKNTRIIDVINMAGGLTNNADTSVINLSKKVTDEMVIIIYSKQEVYNFLSTKKEEEQKLNICKDGEIKNDACIIKDSSTTNNTGKININTANIDTLKTLPGVGETKAKNIIKYREKNGNFTKIEDIKLVEGIGDSIYDQIKEIITI